MNLPREIQATAAWTELCELCDWDDEEVALTLQRYMLSQAPIPVGRVRELCSILHTMTTMFKSVESRADPEC